MKLFFLEDDSLYKIFKTLEKAPKYKRIEVYIETSSPFFAHQRRGKQIKELIKERWLIVVFATRSLQVRNYYKKLGLPVLFLKEKALTKILKSVYLFFFNIKKFHLLAYNKTTNKNYTFYVVFFLEICVILFILRMLYGILLPKTTVVIHPNYNVESVFYNFRYYPHTDTFYPQESSQLTIPYYTWSTTIQHNMSIASNDMLYLQTPSQGKVRIVNKTKEDIPLLKGTELMTDDGLLFLTDRFVHIPAAQETQAGYATVTVTANDVDKENILIWKRGNITKGTTMYIRKLKASKYKKDIYIEALYDFVWWETNKKDAISSGDIQELRNKIGSYLDQHKLSLLREKLSLHKHLLIPLEESIAIQWEKFTAHIPQDLTGSVVHGEMQQEVNYIYVAIDDVIDAFDEFITKRTHDITNLTNLQEHTISFVSISSWKKQGVYNITTKIDTVRGYNFKTDKNLLLPEIRKKIVGTSLDSTPSPKSIVNEYEEISVAEIKVSPRWYDSVSKLQSRIFFSIKPH